MFRCELAVVLIDTSTGSRSTAADLELERFAESANRDIFLRLLKLLQGVQSPERFAIVWETLLSAREVLDDPMPLARFEYAAVAAVARRVM